MITFLLYAISAVTGSPIPGTVYLLTSLIDGVAVPLLFTIAGGPKLARVLREKFGRLHYLQAVQTVQGVMLVLTPWGYEFAPVEGNTVYLKDGMTFELGKDRTWYKLAKTRFGVTYVPTEEVMNYIHADDDEIELEAIEVETEDGETGYAPAIMHGKGVLTKVRGAGFHGYTPYPDRDYEGFLVSLSRAINSLRGGGTVRLSEKTEQATRREHGGGKTMSNWARVTAYGMTMLFASVIGILIFGVF